MRSKLLVLLIGFLLAWSQTQAGDVGVSVSIGQPGFYGRLELGNQPQAQLIYPQPMLIDPGPRAGPLVYLRVQPGHERDWRSYCRFYAACGQPVYFVHDDWYRNAYAPQYNHRHERGDGRQQYHDERGESRRDERRDYRRDGRHNERGNDRRHERDER